MNTLDNTPIRPAAADLVFKLALGVVPQASRGWIKDMRLEASYIEPDGARVRWALGALMIAFRFRLAALAINRPQVFTFASVMMVAVVAVFVIVPQRGLKLSPASVLEPQAEALDLADRRPEPSTQMPAESSQSDSFAEEGELRERSQDSNTAVRAEARAVPAPLDVPETETMLESDETTPLLNQKTEIPVFPTASSEAEADALGFADASVHSDDLLPPNLNLIPPAITEVKEGPVILEVRSAVWLELYEGPVSSRRLVSKGPVEEGESFELTLPFYIQTEDAGAIEVTIEGQIPASLGPQGVALGRLFRLSR